MPAPGQRIPGLAGTQLLRPCREQLGGYAEALRRGFHPSTHRGDEIAAAHLAGIAAEPDSFLERLDDPVGRGTVSLPDGREVPRLPGFTRWIVDDGFCGAIHFRWQPGGESLPAHVLGHVGYQVVAWRRRQGHATRALRLLLPEVAALGLRWVDLTTDPDNLASIRVIEANGGAPMGRFRRPPTYGGGIGLTYRIHITDGAR